MTVTLRDAACSALPVWWSPAFPHVLKQVLAEEFRNLVVPGHGLASFPVSEGAVEYVEGGIIP